MSDTEKTPTYLKDESGFCYAYTALLAKEPHLTPYDGDVDENGFVKAPKKAAKQASE
jgi:hypothetical protein